jgi:hypothetical protein
VEVNAELAVGGSCAVEAVCDTADACIGPRKKLTRRTGKTVCIGCARKTVGWVAGHCLTNSGAVVARQRQATHRGIIHVSVIGSFIAGETLPIHAAGIAVDSGTGNALQVLSILRIPNGTDVVAECLSSEEVGSGFGAVEKLEDDEVIPHSDPVIGRCRRDVNGVLNTDPIVEEAVPFDIEGSEPHESVIAPEPSSRISPSQPSIIGIDG